MIHLGDVIDIFHIAERGFAVMLNVRAEDLRDDLCIHIDDPVRVVAADDWQQDTVVRGIEVRPCVTILLPVDVDPKSVAVGDRLFLLRSA